MSLNLLPEIPSPGFSFENFERNDEYLKMGVKPSKVLKTGTTLAGVVFEGGIVMGTDNRASAGSLVADKNCRKIHPMASNLVFCGAGTSADCDAMERMIKGHIELHKLNSGKEVPVCVAVTKITQHLHRYQGYIGCALIVGGVDKFGSHLLQIYPHGSYNELKFTALGSGSLAAMSQLELNYKLNMSLEEAKLLVRNAILAGIENDAASGNQIDITVITKDGMEMIRPYEIPAACIPVPKQGLYKFPLGTTPILDSRVRFEEVETIERQIDPDRFMETA